MAAFLGFLHPLGAQTARPGYGQEQPGGQKQPGGKEQPGETEEEPTVEGVAREWNGGWLGLAIEENAFVLRFYDADKKSVSPAAARAAVRWDPIGRAGTDRTILNPGMAPDALRSPSVVRPPHLFVAWVTLFDEAGAVIDTLSFDFRELRDDTGR